MAPVFDAATGYALLSGRIAEGSAGTLSQGWRALLLLIALALLKPRARIGVILLLLWLLIVELHAFVLHQQVNALAVGIAYTAKIIYLVTLALLFRSVATSGEFSGLIRWYMISVSVYAGLTAVPTALGLNFPSYDEGSFGSKGWFASGNGLGTFLGVSALALLAVEDPKGRATRGLTAVISLLTSLLVATKAAAAIALLALVRLLTHTPGRLALIALPALGVLIYQMWENLILISSTIFEVAIRRYNASDLLEFITSSRLDYLRQAWVEVDFSGVDGALRLIVGAGPFLSFRTRWAEVSEYDTLETDLFDVFYAYGVVGLLGYLGTIAWITHEILRARAWGTLLAWIAIIGQSIMAGHVLYNGMSALAFAFVVALARLPRAASLQIERAGAVVDARVGR